MNLVEYDLGYIQAGLDVLEKYLLSDEVFWPLAANPPKGEAEYPRLTLDGLLLAKARLCAYQVTIHQKAQVERIAHELELNRSKWRMAWEKKAGECYRVRIRLWQDYLEEYKDNPVDNSNRYTYIVRYRAMLDLVQDELRQQNTAQAILLASLDGYLKSVIVPAVFIWDAAIQAGFPPEKYWYLYGKLPQSGIHKPSTK
jgi:hypothetical protein